MPGKVEVNGSLFDGVREDYVRERMPGEYLTLVATLSNDSWVPQLGQVQRQVDSGADATESSSRGFVMKKPRTDAHQELRARFSALLSSEV